MNLNLWYHDGSGYGWPALETGREEEIVEDPDHPDATLHLVSRNLIVFCGGEKNLDGLEPGVNVRTNVPEGPPTQKGSCSLIAWQPGTPQHAAMVTHGLAEGAVALENEREKLRLDLLANELAAQALEERKQQVTKEHGLDA